LLNNRKPCSSESSFSRKSSSESSPQIAGHVTAQKLNGGLSGDLECFFGSGRDEGLAQRKARHAGLGGCAMVSSHRFFS